MFVRSHKGITGNEEADKMADWNRYYGGGEVEEGREDAKRWTERELKEEGKMGIRWERNRKLMEAKEYHGGNHTGETARHYCEVIEGGECEISKGERPKDVNRVLSQLQSGNSYWLVSYQGKVGQNKIRTPGAGGMVEEAVGGKCAFCGERARQSKGGIGVTVSESVQHLMGERSFFEGERTQWMKVTGKIWQNKELGTEHGANLVEHMVLLVRKKIIELKWNPGVQGGSRVGA